ncbi:MAG: hypothetical protein LBE12_02175 [Planctomycetaceae bacterium]|nr:hypothetical protein [Planctomycetaceae bacterium]
MSPTLSWAYWVNGGTDWIDIARTSHIIYVTWGKYKCKVSEFTKKHIQYACKTAGGSESLKEIGEKIGADAVSSNRFVLSANCIDTPWDIIDKPTKSDCISLCTFMKKVIELLGDDSAEIWYVYARHRSWLGLASKSSTNHEKCSQTNHNPHVLGYWAAGGFNYWEACCRFQNKWWMGGEGKAEDHPIEILRAVTKPNTQDGNHQCDECVPSVPVSYPWTTDHKIPDKNENNTYPIEIPNYE